MPADAVKDIYKFESGDTPVIVSVPHAGRYVPAELAQSMTPAGLRMEDTDWFVDELYDAAPKLGIGLLAATHSRYVVDLNRDPSGASLYPGRSVTEIVPATTFAHEPIYAGDRPDAAEVARRIARYWTPYHEFLQSEIARLKAKHGLAVLWEGHSICSSVPRFFEGRLPDMNFGTVSGASASPLLVERLRRTADSFPEFSTVWDKRFLGGYITRTYGRPENGVHAIQLEMTWDTYMDEHAPHRLDPDRSKKGRAFIEACLRAVRDWALEVRNA